MIVKKNGKYQLKSKTGDKVLGTHDTKKEALEQERAIKASKKRKS